MSGFRFNVAMGRNLAVAGLVLAFLAALSGCDRSEAAPGAGAGTTAPPERVRLGYFANVTHAQAVLGVASGEYAAAVAPSSLDTKVFNAGPSVIEALFAGEIDLAYIGPGPALNAHAKTRGTGVRVIAGAANNGVVIVAGKDSGVTSLDQLRGKRLATPQHGNTQDISARHYVKSVLKEPTLDNIVPIANTEQAGLLARGEIAAAWVPEPWGALLTSQAGAKIIAEEKDLWPGKRFNATVILTTPKFLSEHPQVVEKLLAAHRQWTQRLTAERESVRPQLEAALFNLTRKKLPEGVLADALSRVEFTDEPLEETFSTYAAWTFETGLARAPIDTKDLIDKTVLKRVQQSQKTQ
jgi:NitT/TauT family transport system substrate-binding protein